MLAFPIPAISSDGTAKAVSGRDGQHDFDFNIGTWKTKINLLQHPLTGAKSWVEATGTVVVRKVWNGRANLEEIDADKQRIMWLGRSRT
jgi:hypothetical protein